MSEPNEGGAPDGVAAVDGSAQVTPPADAERAPNLSELVSWRKEMRSQMKQLDVVLPAMQKLERMLEQTQAEKPAPKKAPADAGDADLRAQLGFRDALDDLEVKLTRDQKSVLREFYMATKPENPGEWVKQKVSALGFDKPEPPPPAVIAAEKPALPDMGPPASGRGLALPLHPAAVPKEVADRMTPWEARAHYEKWIESTGIKSKNWFAEKKKRFFAGPPK